jgi:hypothetical protein
LHCEGQAKALGIEKPTTLQQIKLELTYRVVGTVQESAEVLRLAMR